jgi:hypothetical protein
LGGQQIAIAQTTDIDRPNGMVNLTTVLLHTSGEWISSDWPVCQLSETSAPRRMGAALTYARRYALFTMVGIAGEDDLDAPDIINDQPKGGVEPAPVRASQSRTGNPGNPFVREQLSADKSAEIRAQLIREIEALPVDDMQPRAIAILKTKNRLSAEDAKLVEESFAARIALQAVLPDASAGNVSTSEPVVEMSSEPLSVSAFAIKPARRRGGSKKAKTRTEAAEAPEIPSASVIADNPAPSSTHLHRSAAPAKIEKSELIIAEPRRHRDKTHLQFVATQPCLICGRTPSDAHHLRFTQPRAMGRKVSDEFTVPLCRTHHRDNHRFGNEQAWWLSASIDPLEVSQRLWASTRGLPVKVDEKNPVDTDGLPILQS